MYFHLPVTICSSAGFLSFFLKQKSPRALDNAKLPANKSNRVGLLFKKMTILCNAVVQFDPRHRGAEQ